MTFEFRGMRLLRFVFGIGALSAGVGFVAMVSGAAAAGEPLLYIPAAGLGLLFLWLGTLFFRSFRSGVTVGESETRVDFAGIVSLAIPNDDMGEVRLAHHPLWAGVGARLMPGSTVVLTGATGDVAEIVLARPQRIWLIPLVLPVRARRLRLGVHNPQALIDRLREGHQPM